MNCDLERLSNDPSSGDREHRDSPYKKPSKTAALIEGTVRTAVERADITPEQAVMVARTAANRCDADRRSSKDCCALTILEEIIDCASDQDVIEAASRVEDAIVRGEVIFE